LHGRKRALARPLTHRSLKPLHLMNSKPLHLDERCGSRIAAACAGGVSRPCYRFTRPGEMSTPPPHGSAPRLAREVSSQSVHTMAQQLCIMCKSSAHVWKIELHPLGLLATLAHTSSEGFSQSRCADPVASRSRAVAPFPYVIGAASDYFDLARSRDRTLHRDCGHTADTALFVRITIPVVIDFVGAPGRIRTADPQIRSLMLYQIRLSSASAKLIR
jgi:hypothetical protein